MKRSITKSDMVERSSYRADRVLAVRKMITYDTLENRFVKYMLRQTIRRMEDFSQRYVKYTKNPDLAIVVERTAKMQRELKHLLTGTFLAEVSEYQATQSMSLVFSMAPGYQELYRYYLMLQNGITVGGDIFQMSVRETAQLYEYWCFIKLYAILKEKYDLKSKDININTMHRYRDAIVYENADSRFTFEKTMFGAYILFPYGDEDEYRGAEHHDKDGNVVHGHRFYRSIDSVNIGGLPFLPSATGVVMKRLMRYAEMSSRERG